jgi:hypothetical protein
MRSSAIAAARHCGDRQQSIKHVGHFSPPVLAER